MVMLTDDIDTSIVVATGGATDSNTDEDPLHPPTSSTRQDLLLEARQALAEQRVLARLMQSPHEHIVQLQCTAPDGTIRYATVDNNQLARDLLPLPASGTREVVTALVGALAHLHQLGIIHRDVKPEHVLVSPGGHVRLTGFGSASDQPRAQSLIGTPEFLAPEVFLARAPYTSMADWWSLGAVACELLTGQTPFADANGSVESLLRKILYDPIVVPAHANVGTLECDFIVALITRDPLARLGAHGAASILAHAWLHNA